MSRDPPFEQKMAELVIQEVASRGPCKMSHAIKHAAMRDKALLSSIQDKILMVRIQQKVLCDSRIEVVDRSAAVVKYVEGRQQKVEDPLNPSWLQKVGKKPLDP